MDRVRLLLDPQNRKSLKELANESNSSMSALVRELLHARIKERKCEKLRRAAALMAQEYLNNSELTNLNDSSLR